MDASPSVRPEALIHSRGDGYNIPLDIHILGPSSLRGAVFTGLKRHTKDTRQPCFQNSNELMQGPPERWWEAATSTAIASNYASSEALRRQGVSFDDSVVQKHVEELFAGGTSYDDMPCSPQPIHCNTQLYPWQLKAVRWMMEKELPLTVEEALKVKSSTPAASVAAGGGVTGSSSNTTAPLIAISDGGGGPAAEARVVAALRSAAAAVRKVESTRAFFWERRVTAAGSVAYFNVATGSLVSSPPPLPRGGILADEMGLGKTLTTIALLLSSPGGSPGGPKGGGGSTERKTLIVAPLSVLSVWREQFMLHVKPGVLSVCVHHGLQRATSLQGFEGYDVVLTTYATLQSETIVSSGSEAWTPTQQISPLHLQQWHRVILDEAHAIKNKRSLTSKAACLLRAPIRWCLTGTPIQNNLSELQALVKFLRLTPMDDEGIWKSLILRPLASGTPEGFQRLSTLLTTFCLRRTKDQRVGPGGGTPLVSLPPKSQRVVKVPLSSKDRGQYDALEGVLVSGWRSVVEQGGGGGLLGHSSDVLELILRLRQLSCLSTLVPKERLEAAMGWADRVKTNITDDAAAAAAAGGGGVQSLSLELIERLCMLLEEGSEDECSICMGKMENPAITHCRHQFCLECIQQVLANGGGGSSGVPCPLCRHRLPSSIEIYPADKLKERQSELLLEKKGVEPPSHTTTTTTTSSTTSTTTSSSTKVEALIVGLKALIATGQNAISPLEGVVVEEEKEEEGGRGGVKDEVLGKGKRKRGNASRQSRKKEAKPSAASPLVTAVQLNSAATATAAAAAVISGDPTKSVVFSSWTSLLDAVEKRLVEEGITFVRLDGTMNPKQRTDAVTAFQYDSNVKVALVSIKAGGTGLTLTAATQAWVMEPGWNPGAQDQAVDRIHRLGQTAPVTVNLMVAQGTIEERIVELQNRKRALASGALGGVKTPEEIRTMRLNDLKLLVGV